MINEASLFNPPGENVKIRVMDEIEKQTDENRAETQGDGSRRRDHRARQILYLDLSDLMEYAKHNGTLSGIQRVVSSILTYAGDWWREQANYDIVPVVPEYDLNRVRAVDLDRVVEMIILIEERIGGRDRIDAAIEAVYDSRTEVSPRRGDLFVIAGAFWIYAHYELIKLLRAKGVIFGLFVHDLIQIKNPEFVHKEATLVFRRSLIDSLSIANFVLTNSLFVADEVKAFLTERLGFDLPIAAVPLATELRIKTNAAAAPLPDDVADILPRDYVLCVGTIEVRKNHLLLVKIWERLAEALGDALPDLVFVGKWGWDIAPLRQLIDESDFLDGRLRVVTDASDAALVQLYRHCLMTAYVSFAEGFGLPVGESLAYGKPCVASRATSLPEVGGAFAKYIDPNDPEEGVELFKSLLTDRAQIARWSEDIKAHYAPKTWRAFTSEFFDVCCRLAAQSAGARFPNNCLAPAGAVYYLGNDAVRRLDDEQQSLATLRMARDEGWHPVEDWGCWAAEPEASLHFRTDLPAGTPIIVSLKLQAPPDGEKPGVSVRVNSGRPRRFAIYRSPAWYVVSGVVAADCAVHVEFHSQGDFGKPDTRRLYVGLQALEIVRDSLGARNALLRQSVLTRCRAATRRVVARAKQRVLFRAMRDGRIRRIEAAMAERVAGLDRRLSASLADPRLPFVRANGPINAPLSLALPGLGVLTTPPGQYMTAANCLARDFYAAEYMAFCASIGRAPALHRREWEYAFAAHHLMARGFPRAGARGLAISTRADPLIELFTAQGHQIELHSDDIVVDRRYDFLWSVAAVLNDTQARARRRIIECVEKKLVRGGLAVFTGDFNISAYARADVSQNDKAFRRADIEDLAQALAQRGHKLAPLPFELGLTTLDALVDMPPYASGVHLKIIQDGAAVTCFGMVIVRGEPKGDSPPDAAAS